MKLYKWDMGNGKFKIMGVKPVTTCEVCQKHLRNTNYPVCSTCLRTMYSSRRR